MGFIFKLILVSFVFCTVTFAQNDTASSTILNTRNILPTVDVGLPEDSLGITIFDTIPKVMEQKLVKKVADSIYNRITWRKSVQTGVNVNQATFSDNWKGGGISSIAIGLFFNGRIAYETEKASFNNEVQFLYGIVKNQELRARKNADKIFIDSKYGYKITKAWNIFFSINFLSQFDIGYKFDLDSTGEERRTLISRFMSPAYLTSSLGIEYKPLEYFFIRFGTGTLRQTFVLDTAIHRNENQNYGVPVGKRVRNEVAFQVVSGFDKDVAKNLNIKARWMAFANYQDIEAVDIRFDLSVTAKITKYIDVNLSGSVLYDQDMDYKTQYTQALALGILYSYSEFKK